MKFQLGIVAGAAAFCLGSSPVNGATPELIPHGDHFHTKENLDKAVRMDGGLKKVADNDLDIDTKPNVFLSKAAEEVVPEFVEKLRTLVEQAGGNLPGKNLKNELPAVDKRVPIVAAKNETDKIAVVVDAKDNDVVNVNTVVLQDGPADIVDVIVSAKDNVDANINTVILEDFPTDIPTAFPYSVPTPPPFPSTGAVPSSAATGLPASTFPSTGAVPSSAATGLPASTVTGMLTEFPASSIATGMLTELPASFATGMLTEFPASSIGTGMLTEFPALTIATEIPEVKSLLPADKTNGAN